MISQSDTPDPQVPPGIPPDPARPQASQRQLNSQDILQGEREVWIMHNHDIYRLRETKNGKLILQK